MVTALYKFQYCNKQVDPSLIGKLHVECNDENYASFIRISLETIDLTNNETTWWSGMGERACLLVE